MTTHATNTHAGMSEAKLLCSRRTKESVMRVALKVCVVTVTLNLSQTF